MSLFLFSHGIVKSKIINMIPNNISLKYFLKFFKYKFDVYHLYFHFTVNIQLKITTVICHKFTLFSLSIHTCLLSIDKSLDELTNYSLHFPMTPSPITSAENNKIFSPWILKLLKMYQLRHNQMPIPNFLPDDR